MNFWSSKFGFSISLSLYWTCLRLHFCSYFFGSYHWGGDRNVTICRYGGIGRRSRLKIYRRKFMRVQIPLSALQMNKWVRQPIFLQGQDCLAIVSGNKFREVWLVDIFIDIIYVICKRALWVGIATTKPACEWKAHKFICTLKNKNVNFWEFLYWQNMYFVLECV